MEPAGYYAAAREFLARARPTPAQSTYKRRVQGIGQLLPAGLSNPGARLRPTPSSFELGVGGSIAVMGSGAGEEIEDSAQHLVPCVSYDFNSETDPVFCGALSIKYGSLDCGPGNVSGVILTAGEWGCNMVTPGYGEYRYDAHTYKHARISTKIRNPMSAMTYAGLWVEGDDPGTGIGAVIDPAGSITMFDQGGVLDGGTTTFVEGGELAISCPGIDGGDFVVTYPGAYLANGGTFYRFGKCGIYGFGKGWVQTLKIQDARCASA